MKWKKSKYGDGCSVYGYISRSMLLTLTGEMSYQEMINEIKEYVDITKEELNQVAYDAVEWMAKGNHVLKRIINKKLYECRGQN